MSLKWRRYIRNNDAPGHSIIIIIIIIIIITFIIIIIIIISKTFTTCKGLVKTGKTIYDSNNVSNTQVYTPCIVFM